MSTFQVPDTIHVPVLQYVKGNSHYQGNRGNSRDRDDRSYRGNGSSSAGSGYRGRQIAKSSGNVPPKKGAEAKDMAVLKAVTLEETITLTPVWNRENLPQVYRENPDRPPRPVQIVIMGGHHLRAIQDKLVAIDDPSVF